jgi:hypothetical protein
MQNLMEFDVHKKDGSTSRRVVDVKNMCLGRAASRDVEATKKDFEKIRAQGFALYTPPNVCKKSRYLLTNENTIEVQADRTMAEVEYVAIFDQGEIFVSAGSDHNDGSLIGMWTESTGKVYDPAKAKQACPAVVAKELWPYSEVQDHWDSLRLRSWVTLSGTKTQYQDYPASDLVDVQYYLREYPWLRDNGTVLLSGSSNAVPSAPPNLYLYKPDGLFPRDFHFEIHDPVLNRTISHEYTIQSLEWPDSKISP